MVGSNSLVEMRSISKNFGGLQALKNVSLELYSGEVLGVLGHNGAGKSTLIKILAGAETSSAGTILVDGRETQVRGPKDARACGIETIYQELALCGNLNAPSNLYMGREINKWGFLDKKAMKKETASALRRLNIRINSLETEVEAMSGGQRQAISISRAVHFDTKILIMDEPTAALGMDESKQVMDLTVELKNRVSALYGSAMISMKFTILLIGSQFYMAVRMSSLAQHAILQKMRLFQ